MRRIGRMPYPATRVLAQERFGRYRGRYHPIAVAVIGARLGQAARGDARTGPGG